MNDTTSQREQPTISVCIPCYNVSEYLKSLFLCLEEQIFQNFDIIFMDDGSTDDTLEKIKTYSTVSKHKVYYYSQHNQGVSVTRNNLIQKATGIYLFFLDPDDTIPLDALQNLYNSSDNGTVNIVTGKSKVIFNNRYKFTFVPQHRTNCNFTSDHYVKSNLCTVWGTLFKRELFDGQYFLANCIFEDIGLISYIFLKNKNYRSIKNIVYFYNRRFDTYSLSKFNKANRWKNIDLKKQCVYAFNKYKSEEWLIDAKMRRIINGTLFQIIIANAWLSKHYSNNRYINLLPMYDLLLLFHELDMRLRFSKTFWKSVSYFYINHNWLYRNGKQMLTSNKINLQSLISIIDENSNLEAKLKKEHIYLITRCDDRCEKLIKNNPHSTFLVNCGCKIIDLHNNILLGVNTLEEFAKNERIHFINLRNEHTLTTQQVDIINGLDKRLLIFLNPELKQDTRIKNTHNIFFM